MTTQPTTRHIAHAITDLAAERVREAWRYLDTWTSLEAGGVPHEQIRARPTPPHGGHATAMSEGCPPCGSPQPRGGR
jgi:hypothetical protein